MSCVLALHKAAQYLFIILMTLVMIDAKAAVSVAEAKPYIVSPDLMYADDTVLMASSPARLQCLLDNVTLIGRQYGLELNLAKTVLLRVRGQADIFGADGKALQAKQRRSTLEACSLRRAMSAPS